MKKYVDEYEEYLKANGTAGSTVKAYISDVNEFAAAVDFKFDGVNEADADSFIQSIEHEGRSVSTVNRKISSLRSFYDFLRNTGKSKKNPFEGMKIHPLDERTLVWMSEEEMNALLDLPGSDAAGLRDRALLELMYATGLKVSEVCSLKLSDLNMKVGFLNAGTGSRTRIVPMGKYCRDALKQYIMRSRSKLLGKKEDCGILFLNYAGTGITRQGIWKILKTYGDKTDFPEKVSPQGIRNSFAVHLIQHGADLKSLQELLGHEDIMATKIYLSVTKNRIMDVYDKAFPRA